MIRFAQYGALFIATILLQVLLFNNLSLGLFITPLAYIAFVLLLPMNTPGIVTLLSALVSGVIIDISMGTAGLNTIAMLAVGYMRLPILYALMGRDEVRAGGVPNSINLGGKRFMRYCIVMVLIQCMLFFGFEALTWNYFYLTLLRLVLSGVATIFFVYLIQLLFSYR